MFKAVPSFAAEQIDWTDVRRRIASTPVVVKPPPTDAALDRKRKMARDRWHRRYDADPEHCREVRRAWEAANQDKVKANRARCYEKLKQDPVRLERKRQRQRDYKARKKLAVAA